LPPKANPYFFFTVPAPCQSAFRPPPPIPPSISPSALNPSSLSVSPPTVSLRPSNPRFPPSHFPLCFPLHLWIPSPPSSVVRDFLADPFLPQSTASVRRTGQSAWRLCRALSPRHFLPFCFPALPSCLPPFVAFGRTHAPTHDPSPSLPSPPLPASIVGCSGSLRPSPSDPHCLEGRFPPWL